MRRLLGQGIDFLLLAVPMVVSRAGLAGMSIADGIMVARYSPTQLALLGLSEGTLGRVLEILVALLIGGIALAARAHESATPHEAGTVCSPLGAKPSARGTGLPANLDVNLSHAEDLVACVLGTGVSIGINVEPIDGVIDAAEIARAQFAPDEQASGRDAATFLRMWTLKDAVAKATGLGLALKLSAFACATAPPRLPRAAPALGPEDAWRLDRWEDARHVVALAVRGATDRIARPRCVDFAALWLH